MNVTSRLKLYFFVKYLFLLIVLSSSILAVKQEKDIVTIIVLFVIIVIESAFALLWNHVDFFRKCDVQKTYIEFLEVFIKLKDIYIPRFIYGDFLFNFVF